ncbi:hypothetical protein DXT77_15535 [Pseudomonas sp. 91RF]|jgi:hypothetical protein|uniref:hypothetical protein n=1 Tax=Pseudomonas sp. 91RF TaxID=2292261 RepID=UPI000E66C17B|nr:hypothetical protein [Pseudomonas sp. 91RF]RIJ09852.1 hypothetical protein DXT77_15535 [Pseudomonas sp. 91RF]
MPYAIWIDGWRAVNDDFTAENLLEGESLADQVPQALIDSVAQKSERLALAQVELEWQTAEIQFINNQLMALEEGADALPVTREQWLPYRTRVRNWKEGADGFPYPENRPWRPQ